MSGKRKKGAGKAVPRAYGRLTRHERDTVQRMLERRASCREIARELVSVNIFFTIFTNVFSPIAPTRMRRIRQRGCAAFGV